MLDGVRIDCATIDGLTGGEKPTDKGGQLVRILLPAETIT